jgi:hypothetical protein
MKTTRYVVLFLILVLVSTLSTQVYSVGLPTLSNKTGDMPSSFHTRPNSTLVAVDQENSTYIAGTYFEPYPSIFKQKPVLCIDDTTPGFSKTFNGGRMDGFVIKLDASGETIEYATYVGGSGGDWITSMALDKQGFLYVGGFTTSNEDSFPIGGDIPGFQTSHSGSNDGFIMKIDTKNDEILYSTYIGGESSDGITAITVDAQGNVYAGGETFSTEDSFPIGGDIPGFQQTCIENLGDGTNGFVVKLNPEGTQLDYSTYLRTGSGEGDIFLTALTADSEGCLLVAGETTCDDKSFPIGNGIPGFESKQKGSYDGFVLKLDLSGSSLLFSTFIGGTGYDGIVAIDTDASGAVYLAGTTHDGPFDQVKDFVSFPIGGNIPGYNTIYHASGAFLIKLNSVGTTIEYSTYLSTSGSYPADLHVTEKGQAILAVNGDDKLPVHSRIPGIEKEYKGDRDGYVVIFDSSGTRLEYATFIGGSKRDSLTSVAFDATGKVVVTGSTLSTQEDDFPIGGEIPGYNGEYYERMSEPIIESFVMCIDIYESKYIFSTYLSPKS